MRLFDRSPPPLVDPATCLLPIPEPIRVSRPLPDRINLEWNTPAESVDVFSGRQPHQINFSRPLAVVTGTATVQLPVAKTTARPYFALAFNGGPWHGRSLVAAERLLPLQGAVNFRDIGGYETEDGRVVAWGKLYRSGVLSELTASDLGYLRNLGIRLVCDMRSPEEVAKRPDRLPAEIPPRYLHCPAQSLERTARLRGLAAVFLNRAKLEDLMDEGYTRVMIDDNAALIGTLLKKLVEPANLPTIVHCSAGKDRTAVIVALLLSLLGVPRQTVLADYTLSNLHYQKIRAGVAEEVQSLQRFGITVDHLQAIILVRAERLQKMFDHIEKNYDSVDSYLRHAAGLKKDQLAQIRKNFLVNKFIS